MRNAPSDPIPLPKALSRTPPTTPKSIPLEKVKINDGTNKTQDSAYITRKRNGPSVPLLSIQSRVD
jgi:hypothetical protein